MELGLLCNLRQVEAIREAHEAIGRAIEGSVLGYPLDLLCADVRQANNALATIIGAIAVDDVLHSIFSRFCIGK